MARIELDASEVRSLAADLGRVPDAAAKDVRRVMQRAAFNIKRDMQAEATGSRYFSGVAASISYNTGVDSTGIWAEVGPEIGRAQGSLAWIAYEGHATTGPRFPDPQGALDREADALQRYLGEAVEGLLS